MNLAGMVKYSRAALRHKTHMMYKNALRRTAPTVLMKSYRQGVIRELVERETITSQEQLRARLHDRGIETTQATLSRDIRELGLVKRPVDGAYRQPSALSAGNALQVRHGLARATAEFLRGQEVVGNMIVLRTDAGQAQTLAVAIDRAQPVHVVGTIAGDDTILVICRSAEGAEAVAGEFAALQGQP
jgi:transcriptional regulator of arginine metabolism